MILKELAAIGAKAGGARNALHCQEQEIVGRIIAKSSGELVVMPVEKGKREFGPYIRGTSALKPGLGFYKWEHLLGCKCANGKDAKDGLLDDVTNQKNLRTIVQFTLRCIKGLELGAQGQRKHRRLLTTMLRILRNASEKNELRQMVAANSLRAGAFVTLEFDLDSEPWFADDAVLDYWGSDGFALSDAWTAEKKPRLAKDLVEPGTAGFGTCSVTGTDGKLRRLAISLDGFGKDKPKLAAFNRAAYASRGLKQTYNSPISEEIADQAEKGWQSLVRNQESHFRLEDQVFVFWGDTVIKPWGEEARDPRVWKDLMQSATAGQPVTIAPSGVHVLGVGKHQSNAFVIAWLAKDALQTAEALIRWGRWQTVVATGQVRFYNLTDLVMALRPRDQHYRRREGGKRLLDKHEARQWRDLLYLSYGEGEVPNLILNRLVERLSREIEPFPLDRLVLLNICLCSINNLEVIDLKNLSEDQANAFNAGRLFNLICYAQQKAIGESGKTILASNARLAATRPAQIIGELVTRLNEVYLPKLRRDHPSTAGYVQQELSTLMQVTQLAKAHNAELMGWFWKGFYDRKPKEETE